MGAYLSDLKSRVRQIKEERLGARREYLADGSVRRFPQTPCTVVSLFERGCIERGCSYYEGGPNYEIISPHIGGLPDVTNALYAIYQLVFEERKVGWSELMDILRRDWEGQESLRQYVLHKCICFGNDNDAVDGIAVQIVSAFADVCDEGDDPIQTPGGISTFGRQIEWSPSRLATPFGKKAHDVLAGNFSPTPGTDRKGATAIIRSYCKADLRRMVSGAALDIRLLPSAVKGARGIEALTSLICGFCALGGHFMQIDIADTEQLLRAQEHPAEYPNLSVRISGWNARFVTLNKEWQDMIIEQRGGDF